MTDTTLEAWYVDAGWGAVSLARLGWNVSTFGGTPRGLPPLRGSNIPASYMPGQIFRPKFPDSRVITLVMWTVGIDPATDIVSSDPDRQFRDNLIGLRKLFYNPSEQLKLTRQWRYSAPMPPGFSAYGGEPTVVSATALAQIAGTMEPTMTGPNRADFAVDLLLADPYFYGESISTNFNLNTPASVFNPGDDIAAYNNVSVTFYGPLTYPRLTNSSINPSCWVQLGLSIAAGDSVTLDIANFNATRMSDAANLSSNVVHSGTRRWMAVKPFSNTLQLTSSSTADTGYVNLSFAPPYA